MGKTRRTGDLVTDNNLYVNPTDDSFHVGTGITMYGGSVGIISCTELYLGGTAMAAGLISRVSSRVVATDGQTAFTVSTYDSNLVDVFLNGVKLDSTEYATTNSTTITLVTGASTGDVFEATSYSNYTGVNVDTATNSTNISIIDESSDTTCFPLFANDSSGTQRAKTDSSALTYNAGTGTLSATTFSGDGSNLTGLTGAGAATYGGATNNVQITVDANGRITSISQVAVSAGVDVIETMLFS